MDHIKEMLINEQISPSFHRLKIFEFLVNNPVHPTVDVIYASLIQEIPTLSKTTVYNTLKIFLEKNLIQAITIEENEVRYDATTDFHSHFKCLRCGQIIDIPMNDILPQIKKSLRGYAIMENHLYVKGICKKCQSLKN